MSSSHADLYASIDTALAALRAGRMIIVVDSPDREDEGDLVMAAEHVTAEAINFMATEGRGLICVPMQRARLDALRIAPMTLHNTDAHGTAFHVGVDLKLGHSTGISASHRSRTIAALASPDSDCAMFSQPGHVFPLAARDGGVLERRGHTEASLELMRLAGLQPAAVICEIAREDGEMARLPDLLPFARRHALPLITVDTLVEHVKASWRNVLEGARPRLADASAPVRVSDERPSVQRIAA
jgi:3,4-dihydroxy 2-butanone 4-phosphate synthase/GTP cyclohydrolase II